MTEYQSLFLGEAGELFASGYDRLLPAEESDSLDAEAVAELFRILHTIKGSSGGVDFNNLSRYAHSLENLLSYLRDGKVGYKSGMASFLVDSLDSMQQILDKESQDTLDSADFETKIAVMEKRVAEFLALPSSTPAPVSAPKPVPTTSNDGFILFDPADIAKFEAAQETTKLDDHYDHPVSDDGMIDAASLAIYEAMSAGNETIVADPTPIEEIRKSTASSGNIQMASIRVDLDKIDLLLNRVGELVITNAMLDRFAEKLQNHHDKNILREQLAQLERHIRDLQDAVMSVRMVPMEQIYAKLPKIVRDLAKKLGKQVRLVHSGDSVEIDKMMIEGLNDPLMHIIRNAIDHGLEPPKEREESGKAPAGLITVTAAQENGQIIININDDGRGINVERVVQKAIENRTISHEMAAKLSDEEKLNLVFNAGLSTVGEISDISGRGVGMDVVRSNISKLGGLVRLSSTPRRGTRISIVLPLTLAILDGLNVFVGDQRYILPLSAVVESLQPGPKVIKSNGDGSRKILMLRERFIPIIEMHRLFAIEPKYAQIEDGILIVVRAGEERFALFVDSFGAQQQVVVKSLEKNFRRVRGIGGAMVQGDGTVALILDPLGIIDKEREMILAQEAYL
ncbi:chemotaxis protein CheA [Campylobacterota bacterium]|nr:chemotaxis protein CheA [Campylobacterota bacterium]